MKIKISRNRASCGCTRRGERGQSAIFVVLALGIFLLGFTGLAVDYSNLWFHRQGAQAAADAACQAGAVDMLALKGGATVGGSFTPHFTPGTAVDCSATPTATPCWYAAHNGYDGAGFAAGTKSNTVNVTFPTTVAGLTAPSGTYPYMRVDIVDRVSVSFSALITGSKTQDVRATAKCGLVSALSPVPILVLHPTMANSFSLGGTPNVTIYGGPSRSIQVNSDNLNAVSFPWGDGKVDLSQGGPPATGSDFGVFGGSGTPPCASPCKNWADGTTGHWYNSPPILDPFASLPEYSDPGGSNPATVPVCAIAGACGTGVITDAGCQVIPPNKCDQYSPGKYATGITVKHEDAVFVPGVYYLGGDLVLDTGSSVRPSAATGDGSGGTMFFFAGAAGLNVKATAGGGWNPINSYDPNGTVPVKCLGGAAPSPPITTNLSGNIFLGPCTGTYGDPLGQYRGMIFFQNRTTAATNIEMHGNGGLLVAGNMYFHQNASFGNSFGLWGSTGSDTRVLGDIVVDQLALQGSGSINMQLNPTPAYDIYKVALLQ
jgi:hypothetical protein